MKKLDEMTKDELLAVVKQLKKQKKYGLVWEDRQEDVVEQCKKELPVLEEVKDKAIEKDSQGPTNLLIEGDNYHALSVLNYTHAGKIDVIYIDPPYNTGAQDWKYNNDYVDINDFYRHSKWLAFMDKRLRLAKHLLKKSGILVCTIDHNEQENLGILLRDLFSDCEITCVTIIHNPAGVQGINFSYTNEFAYYVYPKNGKFISNTSRENDLVSPLRDWGTISRRDQARNCFYPIIIKDEKIVGFGEVCKEEFHPRLPNKKCKDGKIFIYPIDSHGIERKWVFSRPSVDGIKDQLFVKRIKKDYVIMRRKNEFVRRTVWDDKKYYANIYGSKLLNQIIDVKFPFPKSLFAVEDCIKAVIHDKNTAIILDFFAGSGTTGHAVLKMNKEDGGGRQFILCTNNENKIAENVCYPRIKKVIKGHKDYPDITGVSASLRYFKTAFISKSKVSDDTRRDLVRRSTDMICVRENTFEKVIDNRDYKIYKDKTHTAGILLNLDAIEAFKGKLNTQRFPAHIYVFSLTNDAFDEDFKDLVIKHKLCPIPESILEVYRKIFRD